MYQKSVSSRNLDNMLKGWVISLLLLLSLTKLFLSAWPLYTAMQSKTNEPHKFLSIMNSNIPMVPRHEIKNSLYSLQLYVRIHGTNKAMKNIPHRKQIYYHHLMSGGPLNLG